MGIFSLNQLDSPSGLSDITRQTNIGKRSNRFFYSAVVIDYISNPALDLSRIPSNEEPDEESGEIKDYRESLKSGANLVKNTAYVDKMPRNSLIAKIVSDGEGRFGMSEIFYPFFSPHMSMPIKPGEQVWIFYEKVGRAGRTSSTIGYWMSRKSSDLQVDDINYTHQDRTSLGMQSKKISDSAADSHTDSASPDINPYSFPLGGRKNPGSNTVAGASPYRTIIDNSYSYGGDFTPEPVPRYTKKSSDMVIQGSNNTLISLGEDFGATLDEIAGKSEESEDTNGRLSFTTPGPGRGTIDIVCGRGVRLLDSTFIYESDPGTGKSTALNPLSVNPIGVPVGVAENTRENLEIDKTPGISGISETENTNEGMPDFVNDLSRLYISMKTNGDENFGITFSNAGAPQVSNAPYIIGKSDEIRLIGRGSVRAKSEAGSELMLMSTGESALIGNRIFLGAPDYAHGDDEHYHVLRGEILLQFLTDFVTDIKEAFGLTGEFGKVGGNMQAPLAGAALIDDACNKFLGQLTYAADGGVSTALSDVVHTE
jgi:hypothetical protein